MPQLRPRRNAMRWKRAFARLITRDVVVPLSLGLTFLAALGARSTQGSSIFTLAHVVPVSLGTWFRGRGIGLSLAALAAGSLSASTSRATYARPRRSTRLGDTLGSIVFFGVLVETILRAREELESERRRRPGDVNQVRHNERLQLIGRLASDVAHELGTPLSIIAGRAEMLAEERTVTSTETANAILHCTHSMTRALRRLLAFGRKDEGAHVEVDLGALVSSVTGLLEHTAARSGCRFEVEAMAGDSCTLGHPGELEQVLTNLLMNAVQSMPHGGLVRVQVAKDDRRAGSVEAVRIAVEDEGSGIAKADLARVFDPFFTTKRAGEGTGLGLAVTADIVREHTGHIDVESEVGRGSRFTVYLPRSPA